MVVAMGLVRTCGTARSLGYRLPYGQRGLGLVPARYVASPLALFVGGGWPGGPGPWWLQCHVSISAGQSTTVSISLVSMT